ncbi:hypothetical protein [Actinoalloteichus caeruleus]|uniref:hypothetical protein n=1 Tax=Actinoalloteichus cyanogriseus TaxID=2893586 RepID=UPI0004AB1DB3|nr:hypothetical protein [Actinoalloteichus caeruleus]
MGRRKGSPAEIASAITRRYMDRWSWVSEEKRLRYYQDWLREMEPCVTDEPDLHSEWVRTMVDQLRRVVRELKAKEAEVAAAEDAASTAQAATP